ncbi:hypothetical protein GQ600_2920 [Phytophthora cactorum]|nr:hypothetical protein GQ600_2920 [Phytophthora cactorum]
MLIYGAEALRLTAHPGNPVLHAANNYFYNNSDHNFDPIDEFYTVVEANYHMDTYTEPVLLTTMPLVSSWYRQATRSRIANRFWRNYMVNTVVNSIAELTGQNEEASVSTAARAHEASAATTLLLSSSNFGVDDLDAVDGSSSSSTTITATISTTASFTVTSTAWSGPASTASAASCTAYTVSSNTTQQETGYALSSSNAQAVDATSETETTASAAGEADDLTVNADASHVSEIAATENSTGSIASSQTSASSTNTKLLVLV